MDTTDLWNAVLRRDAAADGTFYYAVKTTGIYCRPSCPSRHARRENVSFHDTSQAAEAAGFRPCKRCQPEAVSPQQQRIAQAMRLLETLEPTPTLPELGRQLGVSPTHLQRHFKRATGVSPRQYAAAHRAQRLRDGLKEGAPVTTASFDAGYGSSRALYEAAKDELGMTPKAYQAGGQGTRIRYAIADSPLGRFLLAATERGICSLRFGEDATLVAELKAEFPKAELEAEETALAPMIAAVQAHLAGRQPQLELPLDVKATAFQQRVWAILREIPYGETRSYQEIARMMGEPNATRAVARACATNPVALVVPCHRVVRTGGALSGYRWGIERKQALLEQERGG